MEQNQILVSEFKKHKVFEDMVNNINQRIPTHIFRDALDDGLTLREHITRLEDAVGQHTVLVTTRLSYDGVKYYFTKNLNKYLAEKTNCRIKVVDLKNSTLDLKDISFDIIFSVDGVEIPYEIKVTQGKNGWTGTTHSSSKSPNYILIVLSVDLDKKVENGVNLIENGFMLLDIFDKEKWNGKPTGKNSFTSLKLDVNRNFDETIVFGGVKKKNKYYEVISEKIN